MIIEVLPRMVGDSNRPEDTTLDLLKTLKYLLLASESHACSSKAYLRAMDTLASLITSQGQLLVQRLCLDILWEMSKDSCSCAIDHWSIGMSSPTPHKLGVMLLIV